MGSKSKSKSSTDMTTTPQVPSWINDAEQQTTKNVMALGNTDPSKYVAGASDLQKGAWSSAAPGSTQYDNIFNKPPPSYTGQGYGAQGYTASTGTASSLLNNLNAYQSPYTDSVVNSTLAQWDKNAGQQQAQSDLDLAGAGAFGGSGSAIAKSLLNNNLALGRNSTVSGLYDQAFNTAAGLSNQDAQRQQEMSMQNLAAQNTASQFGADANNQAARYSADANNQAAQFNAQQQAEQQSRQLAATQQMATLGDQQRGVTQDHLSAPISLLGTQVGLLGGQPLNMFVGQHQVGTGTSTTSSSPGLASIAGMGLQALAISDVRLKTNIEKVGSLENGLGIYDYNYVWGGPRYRGVMAQDVLNIKPEAVVTLASGYYAVDYGAL